ncbi:MAG: S41 family peptidase [Ilumatobacter sp.]|uniref:S41 family peptidase n=1 Tax=Ilumatobacter sp. TaxID=1967498 RepID=UPI00391936FB
MNRYPLPITRSSIVRVVTISAATAVVIGGCGSDGVEITVGADPSAADASVSVDAEPGSVSVDAGESRDPIDPVVDGTLSLPDGWFEMSGYGTVLHVDGDEFTMHHVTASTCVVGDDVDNELPVDHAGDDGGVVVLDLVGPTTDYRLLPLAGPLECDSGAGESGTALDEVFGAHYPYFAERGIDREAAFGEIRTALVADPSAFEHVVAEFMIELGDGHTTFDELSIDPDVDGFGMPELTTVEEAGAAMQAELDATLARLDGLQSDPTGSVGWGTLDESVGYLLIAGFEGMSGDDDPVADRDVFAGALEVAISDLSGRVDRLVVDVRFNQGGYEDLAVLAAGHFVEETTPAYRKWPHAQPDPFVQTIDVEPRVAHFDGDVVVLTSPITASAAEVFTLAMIEVADATVIGNRSFGEFSDAIDWTLPNGIEFTMSMEVYTGLGGSGYEAVGLPVDVVTRFDAAVDAAIEHLR